MKSNQDRSNECLPPKKRELQSSSLANEERPLAMAPATDTQRTENLAWLASVAGGHRGVVSGGGVESDGPQYKPLSSLSNSTSSYSSSSYSSCSSSASSNLRLVSSLPAVYTSPLSQSAVGGTIHYTQLPPNLQFIASPYPTPYAGYISSQLLPPPPPPPPLSSSSPSSSSSSLALQRSLHMETAFVSSSSASSLSCLSSVSSQASKYDQQRVSSAAARTSMPPPLTDAAHHHYVQVASAAPRTALSPHHQGSTHLPLHPHHMLGHGASQVVVQYADGPTRKEEGGHRPRELHNGELERGRRFESGLGKPGNKSRDMAPSASSSLCGYEGRQLVMSSDYTTHDPSGMRTSLMLMPNSHGDHHLAPRASPDKLPASTHPEKGGIVLGKPVNRTPSTSSFVFPPPLSVDSLKTAVSTLSPHTVIQTTQNATESMSLGLHSPSIYPQPPIIGYIAGGNGQQQPLSYHAGLSQHLLIPGAQPVIIPVSGGGVSSLDAPHVTSSAQALSFPAALPHTYIAAPKAEPLESSPGGLYHQAQLHLPVIPAPPSVAPPPPAASASASGQTAPPSLPPYFIKGSIIQLADGELKHVEDLKTEDFIQSAEISSELKIDSSTVERIDGSHASPNFALVQFSVGEHRAQVSVEVLVEYPFFVFGQGWSSCCPDRTTQLLELPCTKLSVGDVCISLTLKNLRNGSLKKTQSLELATPAVQASYISHGYLKPPRPVPEPPRRHGERENGLGQRGIAGNGGGVENGDLRCAERGLVSKGLAAGNSEAATVSKPTGRKRRWSAPEGRKVEKTEEEPPMTLPKPSFIPHELKVSIEGRSNIGK